MGTSPLMFPSIDNAIAGFEGFGIAGSSAQINNNPGNLVYAPWESAYGGVPGSSGFASFPDPISGLSATDHLVQTYANQGDSLSQLLNSWAGPQYPGNTQQSYNNYVNYAANATGLNPTQPILSQSSILSSTVPNPSNPQYQQWLTQNGIDANTGVGLMGSGTTPLGQSFTSQIESIFNAFSFSRVAVFILGLICLAAGLVMLKPVQTVLQSTREVVAP
jgi:hypothetical protein